MKTISIIIILLILSLIAYLSRHGLFSSVRISEKNTGPLLIVYKKHIGEYKNVGPVMDKIYYDLKNNHSIDTTKGFGLYYDNPKEVNRDKLRSIVGCIVEGRSKEELEHITGKYGVQEHPGSNSVVAEFPYKGKASIILGIFKVYPKLLAYINNENYPHNPIMEVYDLPNQKIEYTSSIELTADFYDALLQ
ncbi:GyrI-like domain-containing protein [Teredinibacter sp. KSP-S5-2]|uniref:GyrI-like domain-containing protein n=1 Tax=Teredinibacter sp. KSP-S5-2 TaxID=3034506 RepID=UPI00293463A8|nr:GyrI-like domain-containing protein [Teredinibacter sp. KSP-S5-2]WNO08478.1 GyrI-like domain-containing protein [Teredinibacter sp. KSP-S5-2]